MKLKVLYIYALQGTMFRHASSMVIQSKAKILIPQITDQRPTLCRKVSHVKHTHIHIALLNLI